MHAYARGYVILWKGSQRSLSCMHMASAATLNSGGHRVKTTVLDWIVPTYIPSICNVRRLRTYMYVLVLFWNIGLLVRLQNNILQFKGACMLITPCTTQVSDDNQLFAVIIWKIDQHLWQWHSPREICIGQSFRDRYMLGDSNLKTNIIVRSFY